jgi:hypothetical protein
MTQEGTGAAKVGQPCRVTKGKHKGKTGTYSLDERGNLVCQGDWGSTVCGKDRCEDAIDAGTGESR